MMSDDMTLVREYAQSNSEQAFATLVSEHVNLVYSVALRQVHDPHLAEEITQTVFIVLARKAKSLSPKTILSGWLCRTARNVSANTLKSQRRRQFREQESQMQSTLNEPDSNAWSQIEPLLDEALDSLGGREHDAIVLRFLDGKELKRVGAAMGTTEDGARMRVNRGLERLREFFTKKGVILSATAIAGAVSANSIQAAPTGLETAIIAAAFSGTTASTTAAIAVTKTIAMTTLHKAIIAGLLAVAAGTGIYEARRISQLREENQTLQQQQAPLVAQVQQLQQERNDAVGQIAALRKAGEEQNRNAQELLKLRGEVGLLRHQIAAKTAQEGTTNQIQFTNPYLRREEWSDKGTDKPLNTILTMFWAIGQNDVAKLEQIVSHDNASQQLDDLTLPKRDWDKLAGVQIVRICLSRGTLNGRMEDMASVETIIETTAPPPDVEVKDVEVHSWSLRKSNEQWLITAGH